jgi:peptidoglycan hydrolase CwlO-like protein
LKKLINATAAGVTQVFKEVTKDKVCFPGNKQIIAKVTVDELVTKLRDAVLLQEGTGDEGKVGELQVTISSLKKKVSELQTERDDTEKEFAENTKELHEVKTRLEQQLEHSEERFAWLVERSPGHCGEVGYCCLAGTL